MSPHGHTYRRAALAAALVAGVTLGVAADRPAEAAGKAGQHPTDYPPCVRAKPSHSTDAMILQGNYEQAPASQVRNTPWQIRINRDTAWLISPHLIERRSHGRRKTMYA
jgi:hypothetical protein